MDPETIQKIAAEVAGQLPEYRWMPWLVQGAIFALLAALGAYAGAFLGEKGKNRAIRDDFGRLKDQLQATTELVEGNKSRRRPERLGPP